MGHPIYHLELVIARCACEVELNGFPVARLAAVDDTPVTFSPPINPYLVGELNMLDVTLHPTVSPGGEVSTFGQARFEAVVRRYEKGMIVAPGEGPSVGDFGIPDDLAERVRDEELELPQSFSHVFANDVVDFSAELSNAPPLDVPEALRDYAVHLRDLFASSNVGGLMAECAPRNTTWSVAYDHPLDEIAASMQQELTEMVAEPLRLDWARDEVELIPRCGGRLWELSRAAGRPLVESEPDADGAASHFQIFASLRDGQLRWVR